MIESAADNLQGFIAPDDIVTAMNAVLGDEESALFAPSAQQEPVVTSQFSAPSLVVAGAGSGKTETMAHRVLWLLANAERTGIRPEQVLGLTFTRKAAGELDARFRSRIALMERAGLLERSGPEDSPKVSTYNSFANELFRDYALLIGRDPNAQVLTEASARMLAREVVTASLDSRLAKIGSTSRVTKLMLKLARAMGDNLVSAEDVREHVDGLPERLADFEAQEGSIKASALRLVADRRAVLESLPPLVDLVEHYEQLKLDRGVVEFSDQVRLAIQAIEEVPQVRDDLRERFPIVLLDEYQDTSVMQVRLLSTLFRGHPVMAVGDPNQSIYGWRGAAAGTLERFLDDFDGAHAFSLPTSWRNDKRILDVANRVASSLPGEVASLQARPGAGEGTVAVSFFADAEDEAAHLATWVEQQFEAAEAPPTAAVLFRARSRIHLIANALADRGLDYVIVGGNTLLRDPAVVDLTAMLKVAARSDEGGALLRVLSSAKWRIGPNDLQALVDYSRALARAEAGGQAMTMREHGGHDDIASTTDALDALLDATGHRISHAISDRGIERMREVAAQLRHIRSNRHLPPVELVRLTMRVIGIEHELMANEHRDTAVLDQFLDEISSLQITVPGAGLDEVVDWILVAEDDDSITVPPPEPQAGVVQLATMHAAKGLEWDLVALPMQRAGTFPGSLKDSFGWFAAGELPYALRGDRDSLPVFDFDWVASAEDFESEMDAFKAAMKEQHEEEERRVAYVAVTRAKRALWMSGAALVPQGVRAAKPGSYLLDAAEELGAELPELPATGAESRSDAVIWPPEPFGTRSERIERAAAMVEHAGPLDDEQLRAHIELLIAGRDRGVTELAESGLPERLNASGLHEWVEDPLSAKRSMTRPLPQKPWPQARLGTLFHSLAESLLAAPGLGDEIDFEPEAFAEGDLPGLDVGQLDTLRETFLASKYTSSSLTPLATEIEIHLPLGSTTVVCKIDAVFADGDRVLVVDWKTGRKPRTQEQVQLRGLQLALYRIAYAEHAGIDPSMVDVELYYVADDDIIRLEHPLTKEELAERLATAERSLYDAESDSSSLDSAP